MNKETLNKLKELCERGGKATNVDIVDLRELIALAERTTSPVSQMTESQIDAVWDSLDGKAIIQGESQCNWNRALRREFARAILVAAAPQAQAPAAPVAEPVVDTAELATELERQWLAKTIAEVRAVIASLHEGPFRHGADTALDEIEARCGKPEGAQPQPVAEQIKLMTMQEVIDAMHSNNLLTDIGYNALLNGDSLNATLEYITQVINFAAIPTIHAARVAIQQPQNKPNTDCSGDPKSCPDNEGYGCACDPMNKAASAKI